MREKHTNSACFDFDNYIHSSGVGFARPTPQFDHSEKGGLVFNSNVVFQIPFAPKFLHERSLNVFFSNLKSFESQAPSLSG